MTDFLNENSPTLGWVWAESYRPKTLDECILPAATMKQLKSMVESNSIPHLLLSGNAGIGKTTVARALVHDMGGEMLFINASLESGIDTIRNKVMKFSSVLSLENKPKFLLFDEFDGLSRQAMESLRGIIEEFKNVRFFFTCNYKNRIIDAIISRTTEINFSYSTEEKPKLQVRLHRRIVDILTKEGVKFSPTVVAILINNYFPDIRKLLNVLQSYSAGGAIDEGILTNRENSSVDELIAILKSKKFAEMRRWVAVNSDIDSTQIFRTLYERSSELLDPSCIPQVVLTLAEYSFKLTHSVDAEIVTAAALTEIMAAAVWK